MDKPMRSTSTIDKCELGGICFFDLTSLGQAVPDVSDLFNSLSTVDISQQPNKIR